MRTAAICPTCATYENALCVLYNGSYLANIGVSPLDSLEQALISINSNLVTSTGTGDPTASPTHLGQFYVNTTTGVIYYATSLGLGPASWTIIGLGLGFTAENVVNKTTSASDIIAYGNSMTKYPSVKSIKDYVDQSVANINLQTVLNNGHALVNDVNTQGTNAGSGTLFTGSNINVFGANSGGDNTGSAVNGFGEYSVYQNTGDNVNGIGYEAAMTNSGGNVNAMGIAAAFGNTHDDLNALGESAGVNNGGADVNALGNVAAGNNTGDDVNAMGRNAADTNSGNCVNAIGNNAGVNNTYDHVTLLGCSATADADDQLVFSNGAGFNARISNTNITANRKYELPNASGTIALTSDIPPSIGYLVYTAIISQTGTSAPTAIVLENTIGAITLSYSLVGQYRINSSGLFTLNKTVIYGNSISNNSDTIFYIPQTVNYCSINTRTLGGSTANDILFNTFVEIRVYP